MGCALFRLKKQSLYDSKRAAGTPHGGWSSYKGTAEEVLAREIEKEKSITVGHDSVGFISGTGVAPCQHCGFVADYLCDFPIGRGKTCDLNLCEECAFQVGEDMHVCRIHRKAFDDLGAVRDIKLGRLPKTRRP